MLFMHTQYPIARTWIFAPKREKKITRDKRKDHTIINIFVVLVQALALNTLFC